ncbi:hypothetical protein J2129_001443 [Methanofollis sp. W23]|uniref:hypothetical protein n=1 Tax=Methanofollis sp. W23 TaxID=2817849 RepID=UPI001AE2E4D7|nr:hypothetical protein [Methanofollis sp. W23]MBP2145989.1 hypothetical protein [Methanofollis sp. W23]
MTNTTKVSIVLILSLALVAGVMAAEEVPQMPDEYKGKVTIDGKLAPAGTTITALIDGEVRGTLTVDKEGTFGGNKNIDQNLAVTGYADDKGKTVSFTVNGKPAGHATTFRPGEVHAIALTAKGDESSPGGPSSPGGRGGGRSAAETLAPDLRAGAVTVNTTLTVTADDRTACLTVLEGTRVSSDTPDPLDAITITPLTAGDLPEIPADATFTFAGLAVECGPEGTAFDPPASLTFTVPAETWADLDPDRLVVKWYDPAAGRWVDLETTVDPETMTITAEVSHFSTFALFTEAPTAGNADLPGARVTDQTGKDASGGEGTDWTIPVIGIVLVLVVAAGAGLYLKKKKE